MAVSTDSHPLERSVPVSDSSLKSWARGPQTLALRVGAVRLGVIHFPGMALNTPGTRLGLDIFESDPGELPPGIGAALVPAQPVEREPQKVALLPHTVRYVLSCESRYLIDIRGSFDEYLQDLPVAPRRHLLRTVEKFAERCGGTLQCGVFENREDMRSFRALASRLSSGLVQAELSACEGWTRGYALFRSGVAVALSLCRSQDRTLAWVHSCEDPAESGWSPSAVLLFLLLEDLFTRREYDCIDLSESRAADRSLFAGQSVRCAQVLYLRRNPRNLALVLAHRGLEAISGGTRQKA